MKNYRLVVFIILPILLSGVIPSQAQKRFSFFGIGDMPYHNPEDLGKFKKLVKSLNDLKIGFHHQHQASTPNPGLMNFSVHEPQRP